LPLYLVQKDGVMKIKQAWLSMLIIGVILLFLFNCYLFRQNNIYKVENRELILQNDSLIAVTIELKRQIASPVRITALNK
jgi:hypothetical protein